MPRLLKHPDAIADLNKLWERDEETASIIEVLLEQLEHDQDLLDRLTQRGYGMDYAAPFNVDHWSTQWKEDRNLWRIKVWELEHSRCHYRIIYAFFPRDEIYYVLGILHREFDYDGNHPAGRRILRAYDDLLSSGFR